MDFKNENDGLRFMLPEFWAQNKSYDELIFDLKLGSVHQAAVSRVHRALEEYAGKNRRSIYPVSFDIHFPAPNKGRCPDGAIYNFPFGNHTRSPHPSVIFEVEFTHRSLQAAHAYCMEYFQLIPTLQAVILLKFGPRSETDRSFYAVGVLYRRRPRNMYGDFVEDAVSFGTAHVSDDVPIPASVTAALTGRILAPAPQYAPELPNPWRPDQRPWLTVPAPDIYYVAGGRRGRIPRLVPTMPPGAPDLRLDLWEIVYWVILEVQR
jgi:hypothetical protein